MREPLRSLARAIRNGDPDAAWGHCQRILAAGSRDPALPGLLTELARRLMVAGRREHARACVERLLERAPQSATAANLAGALAEGEGNAGEALRWYRQAHSINPGYRAAAHNLARASHLRARLRSGASAD